MNLLSAHPNKNSNTLKSFNLFINKNKNLFQRSSRYMYSNGNFFEKFEKFFQNCLNLVV